MKISKKKLKILIVSQYFWPENFRINDLAEELKIKNHEITILTGQPNYPSGQFFSNYNIKSIGKFIHKGINIYRAPIIPRYSGTKFRLAINYLSFAISASLFGPYYLRNKKFDIIFVYEPSPITVGIPAVIIKKIKKIPLVFWVQDLWPESIVAVSASKSKLLFNILDLLVKWIYKNCDKILVQSKGFVDQIISKGVSKANINYLPNWAEDFYVPKKLNRKSQIATHFSKKYFNVVFAGNMGAAQSLMTIVNAAFLLRNERIRWIMIGDGRQKEWLTNEVKKRGLSQIIKFIGKKPAKKMPEYFSFADALLMTLSSSPIFSLTIPGKLQSYLACGKPIIAAIDGEGAKVIRQSGAGISVPSENYKKLAKETLRLSNISKKEIMKKGKRALIYYKLNFARDKLISQIEKIIMNIKSSSK